MTQVTLDHPRTLSEPCRVVDMAARPPSRQGRKSATAWLLPEHMRALEIFCARMGMSKERGLEYVIKHTLTSDGQVRPWMQQMPNRGETDNGTP